MLELRDCENKRMCQKDGGLASTKIEDDANEMDEELEGKHENPYMVAALES